MLLTSILAVTSGIATAAAANASIFDTTNNTIVRIDPLEWEMRGDIVIRQISCTGDGALSGCYLPQWEEIARNRFYAPAGATTDVISRNIELGEKYQFFIENAVVVNDGESYDVANACYSTRRGKQLSELSPAAASERVAAALREEILDGRIPPGSWIRQEEVAARLGASRLPVREALRMLAAEGLITVEANRGARVPALDRREVEVLYRMRERLEPLALIESLPTLTDEQLDRILDLQSRIDKCTDIREFLVLDREFHLATYSACDIDHLQDTVTRLWNATQHYRRAFMELAGPQRRWVVNAEHSLLVDAIQRRDPVDAERYLVGHIRRTRRELVAHPEVFAT